MYNFDKVDLKYAFSALSIMETGKRYFYEKTEHCVVEKVDNGYRFIWYGSDNEKMNGEPLDGADLAANAMGKLGCPYIINLSPKMEFLSFYNHAEMVKRYQTHIPQLVKSFGSTKLVKDMAEQHYFTLSEKNGLLQSFQFNPFCRYLFWNNDNINEAAEVDNWPDPRNCISFYFEEKSVENGRHHYEMTRYKEWFHFPESETIDGKASFDVVYAPDGLPLETAFKARIEVRDKGFLVQEEKMVRI